MTEVGSNSLAERDVRAGPQGVPSSVVEADQPQTCKAYRKRRRPLFNGFGGADPFAGSTNKSEMGTESVRVRRSRISTVGFSSWRSRPPT
jgi:hypothetical protein